MERLTVLGGGSWGTAIANLLADKGNEVILWMRSPELARAIKEKRENPVYLPGIKLSQRIQTTVSLRDALEGANFIVMAIPSHGIREVFDEAKRHISDDVLIVSTSKGIEEGSCLTPRGILKELLPGIAGDRIAVLSGPSFAREVACGLPTAVCAASESLEVACLVQKVFSTSYFRVYTNTDVTGVELGGALKNIIALASGISDGLGLGNNARAALITRGLAEIARLGVKMGADPRTFSGLSGLGDLVLTCTGRLSRNHTVGFRIGKGERLHDIIKDMKMVAEGVRTSKAALKLATIHNVDMPITGEIHKVLYEDKPPREAVLELMTRELKGE